MMRYLGLWGIWAALLMPAGGSARAQSASEPSPASSTIQSLPKLAVVTAVQESLGQDRENLEDLLMIELGNQPFLQLVDRQALRAIMREHAIALSNQADANDVIALGKFAGADYLLYLVVNDNTVLPTQRKALVRLVEVATGQVRVDDPVALSENLPLSMAAVREKILAVLRPDSQAANRLTVGIAEFPNRSGTGRSDQLGLDLQKALRERLSQETWAVVLEREYPRVLLDEVDLGRAGLVRDGAVEKLPPADLVISGNMNDVSRVYEPEKPWEVKLDLDLRLQGRVSHFSQTFRSDAVEAAAAEMMRKIEELRRQPVSASTVPEKELWRRQALYLMPKPIETWGMGLAPNLPSTSELNQHELIRAWENVLLLDDSEPEAMTYLGVCLIGFDRWFYNNSGVSGAQRSARVAQWVAGSRLVERALNIEPTLDRAATFCLCIRPLMAVAPARAKEMAQYTLDHPHQFKGVRDFPWIKVALTAPVGTDDNTDFRRLEAALSRADQDPNAALILFPPKLTRNGPLAQYKTLLTPFLDSSDPVAQFAAQRAMGELLCWAGKDAAALENFDEAIAVMEAAYQRCKDPYRESLNNIYRLRIEACQFLGLREEAKQTALAGAEHFMKVGRFGDFDNPIGWLYEHCVTRALGPGEEEKSLEICDVYIAAAGKHWQRHNGWPQVCAKREELLARLSGKALPGMSNLRFIQDEASLLGSDYAGLTGVRMAATAERLWFVPLSPYGNKYCMSYDPIRHEVSRVSDRPNGAGGVAATADAVFFGGHRGLFQHDANGELLKLYDGSNASFPGRGVIDVCEGGGQIFFSFQGSTQTGIAVLDPATDSISVLAPSSRDATREQEPVQYVRRLQWDAVTPRLYAGKYFQYNNNRPYLTGLYGWSPQDGAWQRYQVEDSPQLVISSGGETLLVRGVADQSQFHFVKADQTVTAAVPVPTLIGEPAWDDQRIWVPTASGLYEVERATGQVKWLAYQDGNPFLAVLKAHGRLYVATSRGLYCHGGPPLPASTVTGGSGPASSAASRAELAPAAEPVATSLSVNLSLEDGAKAEITLTLGRNQVLQKRLPGTVQVDLAAVPAERYLYFHCPGYATQWIHLDCLGGNASTKQIDVRLFRKRYVILKCAFNPNGTRNLEGDGVEQQRVALSHWTGTKHFAHDWQIWQKSGGTGLFGDAPYFEFHRYGNDFGFARPPSGVSYETMKEAPRSGYRCDSIKAEEGLALFCRVNGNAGRDCLGYGKILVEAITETPPVDIRFLESP
ncbi:MAG: hypothetical protein GXY83_24010 [Rhodopirellula sp.]|nr:hypothetical protein [Rhodopirellula sp.]